MTMTLWVGGRGRFIANGDVVQDGSGTRKAMKFEVLDGLIGANRYWREKVIQKYIHVYKGKSNDDVVNRVRGTRAAIVGGLV